MAPLLKNLVFFTFIVKANLYIFFKSRKYDHFPEETECLPWFFILSAGTKINAPLIKVSSSDKKKKKRRRKEEEKSKNNYLLWSPTYYKKCFNDFY